MKPKPKPWRNVSDWLALLACPVCLTQDHLPSGGTSHSGRGPFTPTINKINVPLTCLQMLLFNGDGFSVDISSSQMTYVKSTKSTGTPGGSFVRSSVVQGLFTELLSPEMGRQSGPSGLHHPHS